MKTFLQVVLVFIIFLAVDLLWLGFIAKDLYGKSLAHIMAPKVNWMAALLFYAIFVFGLWVFVIQPALIHQNWLELIGKAALFGLVTYATYDLTNLATAKDWPLLITIIDLMWGTTLSIVVSSLSYLILRLF